MRKHVSHKCKCVLYCMLVCGHLDGWYMVKTYSENEDFLYNIIYLFMIIQLSGLQFKAYYQNYEINLIKIKPSIYKIFYQSQKIAIVNVVDPYFYYYV